MESNVTTPNVEVIKEVKKVTPKKVSSEKQIADNKKNAIEKAKEKIKNASKSIFENTDFLNLEKTISKIKVKESVSDKKLMYRFELKDLEQKDTKRLRQQLRSKRNKFANNILLSFQKKDEKSLKQFVKEFKDFYKENYILNDFSLLSISSNNRDKDTELLLNSMLEVIKLVK